MSHAASTLLLHVGDAAQGSKPSGRDGVMRAERALCPKGREDLCSNLAELPLSRHAVSSTLVCSAALIGWRGLEGLSVPWRWILRLCGGRCFSIAAILFNPIRVPVAFTAHRRGWPHVVNLEQLPRAFIAPQELQYPRFVSVVRVDRHACALIPSFACANAT